MTKRVVIVGGGISGLAAAHELTRLDPRLEIRLLEASDHCGGNIATEWIDGFVVERGPDSFVVSKPEALQLSNQLGLESELIRTPPAARVVHFVRNGRLVPLPEGLILGVPTRPWPLLTTPLLSITGKLRAMVEPFIPVRSGEDDESVHEFFCRRLGREIAERIAGPLIGGIYAGDTRHLSLSATFPQFRTMEQRFGSLIVGLHVSRNRGQRPPTTRLGGLLTLLSTLLPRKPQDNPAFLSFRRGMRTLIEALISALPKDCLRLGTPVTAVTLQPENRDAPVHLRLASGEELSAHAALLATPCHLTAKLVADVELQRELAAIRTTSTATVTFALTRTAVSHPLNGLGFVVPPGEGQILAATWSSSKWPHRAPEGHVLIRAFICEADCSLDDPSLIALARRELQRLMGPLGEPVFTRVSRYDRASPQPELGHPERMRRIHTRLAALPGLFLSAGGLDGIGIPDTIRHAQEAARRIAQHVTQQLGDDRH
jgi:oxygen-dependent protoporphyrinogen oxidase